jgi:tryptophan-rich sensory protein
VEFLTPLLNWLQGSALAMYIHNYKPAFTTIELVHVAAVSLVIGSIAIVDLRLIGLASTKRPFREVARAALPWTWAAFAVAAVSGALLFISQATDYASKTVFQVKLVVMLLAGINMLIFELVTARGAGEWDIKPVPPPAARLAGAISLSCWILIVLSGRWTGFAILPE